MSSIDTALRMVAFREEQLRDAKEDVERAVANSMLVCRKCGGRTQIKKLTLLQTYWYERPYGCTGGDTWYAGERQVQCPKCGFVNRDYNNARLARQTEYPKAFLTVEKVYNDR